MTPAETAEVLRQFNEWRRGDYEPSEQPEPPNPYEVGLAIDAAVERLNEIDRLRAHNAILTDAINAAAALMASSPEWHEMHREAIAGLQAVKKEMES